MPDLVPTFPNPLRRVLRAILIAGMAASPVLAQIPSGIVFTPAFGSAGTGAFGKLAGLEEIPGKPGHFLVTELKGRITLLTPGAAGHVRSDFLRITLDTQDDDQGLSPLAFHPQFASNRKFYVRRGLANPRRLAFEEREAQADGLKDSGKPPRTLFTVNMPGEFADHNGGGLVFGNDGFLYIGIGDGGWNLQTPDLHGNGQNREVLAAKVLRIDVDRKDAGLEYAIPTDNPFVADANPRVRKEIWCWGVRNPFRMSVDRLTGDILIGDVGLYNFEKINIAKKGANFGWKLQEHTFCYTPGTCSGITVEPPAAVHAFGAVKCFIAGQTYRGNPKSPFFGVHLFGDHTMKRLLAFRKGSGPVQVSDLQAAPAEMTGFTLDSQNNIYMLGFNGTIYKLDHKDLQPGSSLLRAASRRLLLTDGTWHGLFGIDGRSLGRLSESDLLEGRLPIDGAGLIITAPAKRE